MAMMMGSEMRMTAASVRPRLWRASREAMRSTTPHRLIRALTRLINSLVLCLRADP